MRRVQEWQVGRKLGGTLRREVQGSWGESVIGRPLGAAFGRARSSRGGHEREAVMARDLDAMHGSRARISRVLHPASAPATAAFSS